MPRIQEVNLTFGAIEDLANGKIAALLKKHLEMVARDCMNRPNDKSKRKVILEFQFSPVPDSDDLNRCDHVECDIECKSKLPTFRSATMQMRPHVSGFIFNQDFPDDLNQQPLFSENGEED